MCVSCPSEFRRTWTKLISFWCMWWRSTVAEITITGPASNLSYFRGFWCTCLVCKKLVMKIILDTFQQIFGSSMLGWLIWLRCLWNYVRAVIFCVEHLFQFYIVWQIWKYWGWKKILQPEPQLQLDSKYQIRVKSGSWKLFLWSTWTQPNLMKHKTGCF